MSHFQMTWPITFNWSRMILGHLKGKIRNFNLILLIFLRNIFREFFNGHKAKIVYIGFLKTPENLITIDSEGYLFYWEYDNHFFDLRKKGFIPKMKYRVLTNSI